MERKAAVAKGATSLYVANVIVLLANTLYFLVLTNVLRSTLEVGVVTALNIMIWLLVAVCILAQPLTIQSPIPAPLAVLKFIPELITKNSVRGAMRLFQSSLLFAGTISLVIAVILGAFPGLVIPFLGGAAVLPIYVRVAVLDVVVASLGQVCVGALIALGEVKTATMYLVGWSIARYGLASALLVAYGVDGVLIGWAVGDLLLVPFAFMKSKRRLEGKGVLSGFSMQDLVRYSLYTLVSAMLGFAVNYADRLFTLAQQGLQQLAVYNVAIIASSFTGFAPFALLTVLLPALAGMHASQRTEEMRELIRSYTRYVSIIVSPIAFGFAALAIVALRIFGPEYTVGLTPTVIVSLATGITAVGAVYASALIAVGQLKWYTLANLLGLVALIVLSALLTPFLGLNGPALGRAALLAVATLIYALAVRAKGLLEIDSKAFICSVGGSAVMAVIVFVFVSRIPSFLFRLVASPILAVIGIGVYLGCLRLVRLLNQADVDFMKSMAPARLSKIIDKLGRAVGIR